MDHQELRKLKQQDKFHEITGEGIQWAGAHRQKAIIGAVAAVVLVLLIVGGYKWYDMRSEAAATAFGVAMQTYQTPLQNAEQPVPPGMKSFPTEAARSAAANAQLVQVAKQYGMTRPGKLAEYFAGVTYAEQGQNGPAEEAFKEVSSSFDSGISALGKVGQAQLYQQTNRYPQAIDLYKELIKSNAATVPASSAQLQLASLYEAEGKPEEARKIYAELKDKDKDSKGKPGTASQIASAKLNPQAAGAAQ